MDAEFNSVKKKFSRNEFNIHRVMLAFRLQIS